MNKKERENIKKGMMCNASHTLPKYPIYYECKYWQKDECDEVFINVYTDRCGLNLEGGVYISEGLWVFPDGKIYEW